MISPRNKNPVFIIAPLRSGSTLLHLMLDSHPAISNPGEFDFMFDQVTDEGKVPVMDDYLKWLASDRIFLAKGLLIDRRLSYEELLWSWAEKLRGRKKVLTLNVHRNFQRVPLVFPEAKYIHLLRDPRDVARSCIGMGWVGHVYFGADIYMAAETAWEKLRQGLKSHQFLEVRFEDLITNYDGTIRAICEFLGVGFTANMIDYASNSTYDLPDSSLVYQWKKKYSRRELRLLEGKIGAMFVDRGYELSGLDPITPNILESMALFIRNKAYRIRFNLEKYGLSLYLARLLSSRLGPQSWRESCKRKINQIDINGLK